MTANEELSATLQAKGNGGQSLNYINPVAEPLIYDARGNGDGITWQQKIAAQAYEFAIREKAGEVKFSSNAAKKQFIADAMGYLLKS